MIPERYNLKSAKRAMKKPSLIIREIQKGLAIPIKPVYNQYMSSRLGAGISVLDKDWDNLILLDACRYDFFERQNTIEGKLSKVVSQGANSREFIERNFDSRQLHDTIYITANPFADILDGDEFYMVRQLLEDNWNGAIGTVHPEDVVTTTKKIHTEFPNKRLIVHFMQPHRPYLGPTAKKVGNRVNLKGHSNGNRFSRSGLSWWDHVIQQRISWDETRQAYSETLDIVLDHTEELVGHLNGKSVVSADHGELLGERMLPFTRTRGGHPAGLHAPELYIVPWLEISGDHRDTISEDPVKNEKLEQHTLDNRLKALGYKSD